MTSFGDTAGIGDMLDVPEFFAQFTGKTLNDEVDAYSGATFTSKSAFAAVKTALSGGSGSSSETKEPVSNGIKIADGDKAEIISSEEETGRCYEKNEKQQRSNCSLICLFFSFKYTQ